MLRQNTNRRCMEFPTYYNQTQAFTKPRDHRLLNQVLYYCTYIVVNFGMKNCYKLQQQTIENLAAQYFKKKKSEHL